MSFKGVSSTLDHIFPDKPIGINYEISAFPSEPVSLVCNMCSSPDNRTYDWSFDGKALRPDISGHNTNTITIDQLQLKDFGHYVCTASIIIEGELYSSDMTILLVDGSKCICESSSKIILEEDG